MILETMGTVLSLALSPPEPPGLDHRLRTLLTDIENRFSPHLADSEVGLVNRGILAIEDTSTAFRTCHDLALHWNTATEGAFTPTAPDGHLDLSGVVKAHAMTRIADTLTSHQLTDWCLNVGGDVLVAGTDRRGDTERPWIAGIVDPADRSRYLSQFVLSRDHPALATSGTSERGAHIWSGPDTEPFRQVSVAAGDIVCADALATAILAGGRPTLELACRRWDLAVLAVTVLGDVLATPHFLSD